MPAKPKDPKSAPGLVSVRLQLLPAEVERLRVIAAASPHKNMAVWCREAIRQTMSAAEIDRRKPKP